MSRRTTTDSNEAAPPPSQSPSASVNGRSTCSSQLGGFQSLTATSGYLATFGVDGACPWLIRARPGQRITVVAFDFGWPPAADSGVSAASPGWPDLTTDTAGPACPVFATLEERGTAMGGRAVRLCEVRHRRTVVYSSLSHELVIRPRTTAELNVTTTRGQRLFLHYEGTSMPQLLRLFQQKPGSFA